ncbi:MAG TPA: DUF1835 domain-containing protein [Fibrella sp.]
MTYHVLNGDALQERFLATKLEGHVIIDRECLIVGDVSGDSPAEFWDTRATYIEATYHETRTNYYKRVVSEFDRILEALNQSEFNLWFGYDLFCQVNMWFVLSLLYNQSKAHMVYAVYPIFLSADAIWNDFGQATVADLRTCYIGKVQFGESDLALGNALWNAYKKNDLKALKRLSAADSPCFPYLYQVCTAHIERFNFKGGKGRPEAVIEEIINNGSTTFPDVFQTFFQREGIYGFGDVQLKQLYDDVRNA